MLLIGQEIVSLTALIASRNPLMTLNSKAALSQPEILICTLFSPTCESRYNVSVMCHIVVLTHMSCVQLHKNCNVAIQTDCYLWLMVLRY